MSNRVSLEFLTIAMAGVLVTGPVPAQSSPWTAAKQQLFPAGGTIGEALVVVGDIDGDQVPDFAVGSSDDGTAGPDSGSVALVSGANGQPIGSPLTGSAPGDRFGKSLATADVNGDGILDLIVGAPQFYTGPGYVRVHDGTSMAVLHEFTGGSIADSFGVAVAGLRDVDGDGRDEVVIGADQWNVYGAPNSALGYVKIMSGATYGTLATLSGTGAQDRFGCALADLDDADGDGRADLAVGAVYGDGGAGGTAPGYAKVFSGNGWAQLCKVTGTTLSGHFGISVAGLPDLDCDGRTDLVVGAAYESVPPAGAGGGTAHTYVGVHDEPATSWGLVSDPGSPVKPDQFGNLVAEAGDINGDGIPDFVVCANLDSFPAPLGSQAGSAFVFSAADSKLLLSLHGDASGDWFGNAAAAADLDGNGMTDLVIGARGYLRAYLSTFPAPSPVWTDLGNGLAGFAGVPQCLGMGTLVPGTSMCVGLVDARPLSIAFLVLGLSSAIAPLKGGVLVPSFDILVGPFPTSLGTVSLVQVWPAGVPSGFEIYFQWWIQDTAGPAGFAASNGLMAKTP